MNARRQLGNHARWLVVLAVLAGGLGAGGEAEDAEQPVTAAREAFGDGWFPWYDAETDSLAPLEFNDPPEWEPWKWNLGPVLNVIAWTGLALLIAALVAALFIFARSQAGRGPAAPAAKGDAVLAPEQVAALPFLAERRRDDLLGQARFHYQRGDYSEAIIYLFSHQLLELDRYSVIRLSKGKTNRQYLREARRAQGPAGVLERTMLAFEGVFFGRRTLDRAGFEACWNGLDQFEQQLKAAT